jgi:hypothetical protein
MTDQAPSAFVAVPREDVQKAIDHIAHLQEGRARFMLEHWMESSDFAVEPPPALSDADLERGARAYEVERARGNSVSPWGKQIGISAMRAAVAAMGMGERDE